MISKETLTAAFFTEAASQGIATSGSVSDMIYGHDNVCFSYIATQGRVRFLEGVMAKSLTESGEGLTFEDVLVIKEKADLAAALFMVTTGMLSADHAAKLCSIKSDHLDVLKQAAAAQKEGMGAQELNDAIGALSDYMRNK